MELEEHLSKTAHLLNICIGFRLMLNWHYFFFYRSQYHEKIIEADSKTNT